MYCDSSKDVTSHVQMLVLRHFTYACVFTCDQGTLRERILAITRAGGRQVSAGAPPSRDRRHGGMLCLCDIDINWANMSHKESSTSGKACHFDSPATPQRLSLGRVAIAGSRLARSKPRERMLITIDTVKVGVKQVSA